MANDTVVNQNDETSLNDAEVLSSQINNGPVNNEDLTPEEMAYLGILKAVAANSSDEESLVKGIKQLNDLSKTQKRKMNRASNEIVTERGVELLADTDAALFKEDALELVRSLKTNSVLQGTIVGADLINSNSTIPQFFAKVSFGNNTFKVLIPSYALFVYETGKILDEGVQRKVENHINNMIGASIQFVVYHVDKKQRVAICDRLKALELVGKQNYLTIPRGEETPRLIPGMLAAAKVIKVSRSNVTLCTLGSDCTISIDPTPEGFNEVSWGRPGDCRDLYKTGDEVIVKVLSVDRVPVRMHEKSYMLVQTKVSIRQAQANPMDRFFDEYSEGTKCLATVTAVNDSGVFVNLTGDVPALVAFPKYGAIPERGDRIHVVITQKKIEDDGRKRIFGILSR